MARTTPAAVQGIIEHDVTIPLDPFIETASNLVERVVVPLDYDDPTLELIERWLSAHFYAIRDPRARQEAAGSVSEAFAFKVDLGLDQTRYGQMAKALDTKGGLKALDEEHGGRPGAFWLGSDLDTAVSKVAP